MDIDVPKGFEADLKRACEYLLKVGCTEIFLFGSLAENKANSDSDIDLAVRGLKADKYFRAYGELMKLLDHSFDLIDLDSDNDFSKEILKSGTLKRVS